MSKRIYAFLIGTFILISSINAQITIGFEGANIDAGQNVDIDVTVSDFNSLISLQYSINWDSTVLKFVSFKNLSGDLPNFTESSSLNAPGAGSFNLPGEITTIWTSPDLSPVTIDDGVLFTIEFEAIGDPCDMTTVAMTGTPLAVEAVDENFELVPVASNSSEVMINGTGCGGSGGDGVNFILEDISLAAGADTCMKMTVTNFIDVGGFQFPISWDPTVLSFIESNVPASSLTGIIISDPNAANGELLVLWTDSEANLVSLDDNTILLEVCFTGIGDAGDMSSVSLDNLDDFEFEVFGGANGSDLDYSYTDGKITLTDGPVSTFTLIASMEEVLAGESVCVDITSINFDNISFIQAEIVWDNNFLDFTHVEFNGYLPDFVGGNFVENAAMDKLTWNWTPAQPVGTDYPDNDILFKICFDALGDCENEPLGSTALVSFLGPPFLAAGTGTVGMPIEFVPDVINGKVDITCVVRPCMITNVDHPDCPGDEGGNITVNLLDAPAGCTCIWTNDESQVGPTLVTPDCNLNGVGAGIYIITVECGGVPYCVDTVTLVDPIAIAVVETIENINCSGSGSIDLAVSGGTGDYTYNWDNGLGDTKKVIITTPKEYCVTITDQNACSYENCYNVTSDIEELTVTFEVETIDCFGDNDGAITAIPAGGCPTYTFVWGDTETVDKIENLGPGTYTVTVSDGQNPEKTVEGSYAMPEPEILELEILTVIADTDPDNGNGAIDLLTTGGTPGYVYEWGPNDDVTEDVSDLEAGLYSVTVTDENGCTDILLDIEVIDSSAGGPMISIESISDHNGYSIPCYNECSGVVSINVTHGSLPIEVEFKSSRNTVTITMTSYGLLVFDSICGGVIDAVVTATDANNEVFALDQFELNQPTKLTVTEDEVGCSEKDENTGFIKISIEGGVEAYNIVWDHLNMNGTTIIDLPIGIYSAVVTDGNGCQVMASGINVNDCTNPIMCFKAMEVITANLDGINDEFIITCADDYENTLSVYDRYGKEVYTVNDYDNTWMGDDLPEGGYMWILKVKFDNLENRTYKGTMAILR